MNERQRREYDHKRSTIQSNETQPKHRVSDNHLRRASNRSHYIIVRFPYSDTDRYRQSRGCERDVCEPEKLRGCHLKFRAERDKAKSAPEARICLIG